MYKTNVALSVSEQRLILSDINKYISDNVDREAFSKIACRDFDIRDIEGFGYHNEAITLPFKNGLFGAVRAITEGPDVLQYEITEVKRENIDPPHHFYTGQKYGMYSLYTKEGEGDKERYQVKLSEVLRDI